MTAFDVFEAGAWPVRLLRTCTASFVGLALALTGHRIGGGELASPAVNLAVLSIVAAAAWLLSNRRLTVGQIIGLLLIAQIMVHLGCLVGTTSTPFGPAMIVGHLIATLVTAVVLSRGEHVVWALAERFGLNVIPLVSALASALVLPVRRLVGGLPSHDERRPPQFVFAGGNGLRGPPVGTV